MHSASLLRALLLPIQGLHSLPKLFAEGFAEFCCFVSNLALLVYTWKERQGLRPADSVLQSMIMSRGGPHLSWSVPQSCECCGLQTAEMFGCRIHGHQWVRHSDQVNLCTSKSGMRAGRHTCLQVSSPAPH